MILALLLEAAQTANDPLPLEWARFARAGALSHVQDTVAIASDRIDPVTKRLGYRLRYTHVTLQKSETFWTGSLTCPAIRPMLASMGRLEMPDPAPYGMPGERLEIVVDGTGYFLQAPTSFSNGRITVTSNVGSPLAKWIDRAFTALAPCWSKVEMRTQR